MKKLLLLSLTLLTGCSTYSEKFDCGVGPGVGCKSLSHVNQMVERGQLPADDEDDFEASSQSPKGQRIWIAPHTDENGHYHDSSYLHLRS